MSRNVIKVKSKKWEKIGENIKQIYEVRAARSE